MKSTSKSFKDSQMNIYSSNDKSWIVCRRIDNKEVKLRTFKEFIKLRCQSILKNERKKYLKSTSSKKMLEEEVDQTSTNSKMKWKMNTTEAIILMELLEVIDETHEWWLQGPEEMRLQRITTMMRKKRSLISKWLINQVHLVIIRFQTLGIVISLKDRSLLCLEMQRLVKVGQLKWSHTEKESIIIKMGLHIQSFLQWHRVTRLKRWNSNLHSLKCHKLDLNHNPRSTFEISKKI